MKLPGLPRACIGKPLDEGGLLPLFLCPIFPHARREPRYKGSNSIRMRSCLSHQTALPYEPRETWTAGSLITILPVLSHVDVRLDKW